MSRSDRLVQLAWIAAHDLQTPLATLRGFSRTLAARDLGETEIEYVEMIQEASAQAARLAEELALVARIESGRYEPAAGDVDSLDLVRQAGATLGEDRVDVRGVGATVHVPLDQTRHAITQLIRAAQRHGGLESVEVVVAGDDVELGPLTPASRPVLLGEEIRELSAAAAVALVGAIGGSLTARDETLVLRLPATR